jgi:hypothetical protein
MNLRVWTAAFLIMLPASAQAGLKDDLLRAMAQCAALTDDKARLLCYDQLAPQTQAALAENPVASNKPPTVEEQKSWFGFDFGNLFGTAPKQQTTPQQFGSENVPAPPPNPNEPPPPGPLDSITEKVTDYALTPFGKFIVFLDNGQVWRQIEAESDIAHFEKGEKYTVTISRGMLGSYALSFNDSKKSYKVKRIK